MASLLCILLLWSGYLNIIPSIHPTQLLGPCSVPLFVKKPNFLFLLAFGFSVICPVPYKCRLLLLHSKELKEGETLKMAVEAEEEEEDEVLLRKYLLPLVKHPIPGSGRRLSLKLSLLESPSILLSPSGDSPLLQPLPLSFRFTLSCLYHIYLWLPL